MDPQYVYLKPGMDYRTAQGPNELRGPLSQSFCVKSLLCISYLWLKEVYFDVGFN